LVAKPVVEAAVVGKGGGVAVGPGIFDEVRSVSTAGPPSKAGTSGSARIRNRRRRREAAAQFDLVEIHGVGTRHHGGRTTTQAVVVFAGLGGHAVRIGEEVGVFVRMLHRPGFVEGTSVEAFSVDL